jgi:hypothetical protein
VPFVTERSLWINYCLFVPLLVLFGERFILLLMLGCINTLQMNTVTAMYIHSHINVRTYTYLYEHFRKTKSEDLKIGKVTITILLSTKNRLPLKNNFIYVMHQSITLEVLSGGLTVPPIQLDALPCRRCMWQVADQWPHYWWFLPCELATSTSVQKLQATHLFDAMAD